MQIETEKILDWKSQRGCEKKLLHKLRQRQPSRNATPYQSETRDVNFSAG